MDDVSVIGGEYRPIVLLLVSRPEGLRYRRKKQIASGLPADFPEVTVRSLAGSVMHPRRFPESEDADDGLLLRFRHTASRPGESKYHVRTFSLLIRSDGAWPVSTCLRIHRSHEASMSETWKRLSYSVFVGRTSLVSRSLTRPQCEHRKTLTRCRTPSPSRTSTVSQYECSWTQKSRRRRLMTRSSRQRCP